MSFLKKALCNHEYKFQFAEESGGLLYSNFDNFVYKCNKCGKWIDISTAHLYDEAKKYQRKETNCNKSSELVLSRTNALDISLIGTHITQMILDYKARGIDLTEYGKRLYGR